ncbi:MAG: helix-turn-helix domain-containing protein [Pseudomonadota bacterium]
MGRLARVSTDGLLPHERVAAWKDLVSTYIGREPDDMLRAQISFMPQGAQDFKGMIEYGELGDVSISRMISSANHYRRTAPADAGKATSALVVLQSRGGSELLQDGRVTRLTPGYWSVIDTRQPFSINCSDNNEHLALLLPTDAELNDLIGHAHTRRHGAAGMAKILRELIVSAFQECGSLNQRGAAASADAIDRLLRVALQDPAGASNPLSMRGHQKARILAHIDARLGDDKLDIAGIADALGYSARQIHRIFQDEGGQSVSEYIWSSRVKRCFEALRNPADGRSVTEIALAWGFNSPAHFSRLFKNAFGISPRECRAAGIQD